MKRKYPGESENNVYEKLVETLFGEGGERKRCIGRMVHHLITHCQIETLEDFGEPLIRYRAGMQDGPAAFLGVLKDAVYQAVIQSAGVQQLEFVRSGHEVSRVICDHIASMTDAALLKSYDRLFSPRMGSIFDQL